MVKIGWSEVDISPKKGEKINLYGQFYERITDEVYTPLTVTAFALECDNERLVICSCDLEGIGNNLFDLVKGEVVKKLPVLKDKIILNAIHDHTSYDYGKVGLSGGSSLSILKDMLPEDMAYKSICSNEKVKTPAEILPFLVDKIVQAIVEAWNKRENAFYQNAFGRAVVGLNRRVCYDDGSAKMWGDTNLANFTELEAGNDSGIELIYTFDDKKEITGVIANIACPAQVLEHRSFISGDYWGTVRRNLQKHFGKKIAVLGLCSAAGDQCPRDMIRWVNPETPINDPNINMGEDLGRRADPSMFDISGLELLAKRISRELISVYEELDGDYKSEGILVHKTVQMVLPVRRVTVSEYNNALSVINNFISANRGKNITFEDNAKLHVYAGTVARYNYQQTVNTFKTEIHIIRFGDIAICTNPFELFLNYGNQIRARSKAKQTFIIQLSCGDGGYLPTLKAEQGSHYSAYVSSGITGHEGGDILVRETLEEINNMF